MGEKKHILFREAWEVSENPYIRVISVGASLEGSTVTLDIASSLWQGADETALSCWTVSQAVLMINQVEIWREQMIQDV